MGLLTLPVRKASAAWEGRNVSMLG